ncbi:DUF4870 domain-containing protein [Pseudacidobacterium ailaaui]|jgi:uncharacterized membrane protein|uniref:DUF4870 domain-containing protein n=1 Tax=Pseudacidobacterium ailaaui TaxID=1382359 RepID=UPI00047AAEFE|nr:DUF4870 domain-containing protein [Pseudacidobacterium ailaaui]MBX6359129.1 DUF4870 domain-containing protein [Pseudacidobacterium ailaaui]MCL6464186.1 DUF4870 domain-containing protein [Pseudacidobacterium ailaaui]MDI3253301.1 DUF4870 domain-containing protein [Bacillota bacterium]
MQCPSCHNEVSPQATFCGFCGSPISAAAAASTGGGTAAVPVTPAAAGGLSANAAAAISYITIIPAIVFLVMEPYNKMRLVKFHAIQCIALHVAWFVVWMATMVLQVVLHVVPLIGLLFVLVDLGIAVVFFLAWLMAILKASKGEFFKLPFIGEFAARQAGA